MPTPQFRDLSEFLEAPPPIELPVRGTVYEFPGSISGWAYLICQKMFSTALTAAAAGETPDAAALLADLGPDVEILSDRAEAELTAELFGAARDALYRDQDSATIQHVLITLAAWHALGPDVAVNVWEAPGNRLAPNRAARRAASKPAASRTRSRGSTSGTTSARTATASRGGSAQRSSSRSGP